MENPIKFLKAIKSLKSGVEFSHQGDITTKAEFDKVNWITGADAEGTAITTTTNPHSELTWTKVNNKMTALQTEYDALDYQRKRKSEYPSIEELVVALYDTEDKLTIENKRKAIKDKYPK